jgi:hypothetical protein
MSNIFHETLYKKMHEKEEYKRNTYTSMFDAFKF